MIDVVHVSVFLLLDIGILLGLVILAYKLRDRFRFQDRQISMIRSLIEKKVLSDVNDTSQAMLNGLCLTSLDLRFPLFLGGPSIDSFHVRYLIQSLVFCQPKAILELGSGASSVLLAKAMQRICPGNYKQISIDHDERFLELSKRYAALNGVAEFIEFVHCPLATLPTLETAWYSRLSEVLGNRKVDFLLIDGPPAYCSEQGFARYPALPQLYKHLEEECTIILDDANRPGEKEVINRWLTEFPEFKVMLELKGKGIAIFTRTCRDA